MATNPSGALLGMGLSMLAGRFLDKKKSLLETTKPTPLSTRGAWIPRGHGGVFPVGPRLCAVGNRSVIRESAEGGKGLLSSPKQDVMLEDGWDVLAVGPVVGLQGIEVGGKFIFKGPITPLSHPSGTEIDLGKEGSFRIYWGEETQSPDALVTELTTIASGWPFLCYVIWTGRRLGPSGVWADRRYHLEVRPSGNHLDHTEPWIDATVALDGPTESIGSNSLADADPDVGYLVVEAGHVSRYLSGQPVNLLSWGPADGDYTVLRSEVSLIPHPSGPDVDGVDTFTKEGRVYLTTGTLGATGNGTVQTYTVQPDDGANIAHAIADMLFEPAPQGLGRSKNRYDMDSLNDVAIDTSALNLRSNLISEDGKEVGKVLITAMQDHAMLLPNDPKTGLCSFTLLRKPTALDFAFTEDDYHGLPQITPMLWFKKIDRLVFSFPDRERNFDSMPLEIFDDGQAARADLYKARSVNMETVTHFESAAQLAEIRKPEELSQRANFDVQLTGGARDLKPGMVGTIFDFDEAVRVISVTPVPLNEVVTVTMVPDYWGVDIEALEIQNGGGIPVFSLPAVDIHSDIVEIPEQLLGGFPNTQQIMVLRIRANSSISGASIHLSRDNSTYTYWGEDTVYQTGGTLIDSLFANGERISDTGPTYTQQGPDAAIIKDFTGDDTSWTLGKQLAVIVSNAGAEICYLKKSTVIGGDVRRLDGLIRARYGTRALDHPAGARVYIVDPTVFTAPDDSLLAQNVELFMKAQAKTNAGQVELDETLPVGRLLRGAGQAAGMPSYVDGSGGSYESGDDVVVTWGLQTGPVSAGAGLQGAGDAVPALAAPGQVEVSLDGTGYLEVIDATSTSHTISSAELVAALGSHTDATVKIRHIANGLLSEFAQTLVEAV